LQISSKFPVYIAFILDIPFPSKAKSRLHHMIGIVAPSWDRHIKPYVNALVCSNWGDI